MIIFNLFFSVFKNPFDAIDDATDVSVSKFEIPIETEQALKKIAKRGSETRSKGFKELVLSLKSLPKEHLAEVAVLLRSSFVSVFSKYVFEPEKTNRVALGEVLRLLVSAADLKSFLAPILKDILLNWLLAMYDPVNEVAFVYRKAFELAFPGSGAVDKLLEKFKDTISEQVIVYLRGEKWDSLKEVASQVLGANEDETAFVIEFVKTELTGLTALLNAKDVLKLDQVASLLIQDKSISAPRRLVLYRLYKSTNFQILRPKIAKLIAAETNPFCLSFSIELLDDLKECVTEDLLSSMFSNLPDNAFERLSTVPMTQKCVFLNSIVKFACQGSSTIAAERFDCIWSHFCVPKLTKFATKKVCEKLLFDEKRVFRTIGQLNAVQTVEGLITALPRELIVELLASKPACAQKALILSKLNAQDDLEACLQQLTLSDLQLPEIREFVSTDQLMKSAANGNLQLKDFVAVLENLDTSAGCQMLQENTKFSIEQILSIASKDLIKKTLLQQPNIPVTVKTVSAALEFEMKIFESDEIDEATLKEALEIAKPRWDNPLVLELVLGKRLRELSVIEDFKLLIDRVKVSSDLFLHYRLDDEKYFPIDEFKCIFPEDNEIGKILLFKTQSKPGSSLLALSKYPLKKPENIVIVGSWCFLHGIDYEAPIQHLSTSENDWVNYAMFKAGMTEFESKTPLSSALSLYLSLREKSVIEGNICFDGLLFPERESDRVPLVVLQVAACIEPVLPLKSDKLASLMNGSSLTLLLVSLHAKRTELSREFWRCQWAERLSTFITAAKDEPFLQELSARAAVSLWNVLESPELEILPAFQDKLLQMKLTICADYFEKSSLAQLFVLAAPFLQLKKDWLIAKFFETDSMPWLLALRGALLMVVMDESLVAAQAKLSSEPSLLEEDCGNIIFPLFDGFNGASRSKILVLMELFVSWCEGGKEDSLLQTAFHNVFKSKLFSISSMVLQFDSFLETFDFTPREFDVEGLAAHLVYRLCAQFPLIMAGACKDGDCSAKLAAREIDRIRRCPGINSDNVTINLKPVLTSTTRVVNLSVNFAGEIELEILLQLPKLFPLEPILVEGMKRSGLKESKWKSALMSLQAIFRSTTFNGNILEAVKKWQANALKLFQGLEECAVCYSVVHPSDRSLPGPSCKQCKHRFHASCLYKWFKSSGNATCPLCRALF